MWRKNDKLTGHQRLFLNQSVVLLASVYHYDGVVSFEISAAEKKIFKKALNARLKILKQKINHKSEDDNASTRFLRSTADASTEEYAMLATRIRTMISKISQSSAFELEANEFKQLCMSFYMLYIGDEPAFAENSNFLGGDYLEALDTLVSAFKAYCDKTNYDDRDLTIWTGNKLKIYNRYGSFGHKPDWGDIL